MFERINNEEFIYLYFVAKYCFMDFRYPANQAVFEDIRREEGDPFYSVSGRIRLNDTSYLVRLIIEQKTLNVTAEVAVAEALTGAQAERFREMFSVNGSALPLGFSVALRENRPTFISPFQTRPKLCEEDEMTAQLRFTLSVAAACYDRFCSSESQRSDKLRRRPEQSEKQEDI